jgi:alpha,alpha-trehalose phosphorylase
MDHHPATLRRRYDAVLFDLDGVLTATAALHAAAWKLTFDDALAEWQRRTGSPRAPFDAGHDYSAHVDGRPRYDGVREFLRARAVVLPEGTFASPPTEWSVHGIGNRQQRLVDQALERDGVTAFPGSVRWARALYDAGVRTAVVSSSTGCDEVLAAAGIGSLFELTVDGRDVQRLGLRGTPSPDGFLEAARRLDVAPRSAVVVEDAPAGVAAGRAGGFGLVVGVARGAIGAPALLDAGADFVVGDLEELAA